MSRVLVFTTGGTIASRYDDATGGYSPTLSGRELIEAVPSLGALGDIEVVELANVSSTFVTPQMAFDWAQQVRRTVAAPDVIGAVVTHGTDSLEESAHLFDLVLDVGTPVVFTGAMRTAADQVADGSHNLLCAARVAVLDRARDRGVLVVMNNEIHTARDVTKSSSESLQTFESPNWGPVGLISRSASGDLVTFRGPGNPPTHIETATIDTQVELITTSLGSDGRLIDAAVEGGAHGLVVEGFAGGEITPFMADSLLEARERDIPVVIAARSPKGMPMDQYAEVGEGKWLLENGAIFARYLSSQKARLTLMLALGTGDAGAIDHYFQPEATPLGRLPHTSSGTGSNLGAKTQ